MFRTILLAIMLVVAATGCRERTKNDSLKSGKSISVRFDFGGKQLNVVIAQRIFGDKTVRNSAVLFCADGGLQANIDANYDGTSSLEIGDSETILHGRPLVFVLKDGTLITIHCDMPADMVSDDEVSARIIKTLEGVSDPNVRAIINRFGR